MLARQSISLVAAILVSLVAVPAEVFGQGVALSLASGSAPPGGTVSLNLNLNSTSASGPASLEWTFTYSSSDIASINTIAGPQAAAANKDVYCTGRIGAYTCVLVGYNNNSISSGTAAVTTFQLSSTVGATVPIRVTNISAADPGGGSLAAAGSGSVITIVRSSALAALTCNPTSLNTPATATCTVSLTAPAPASGLIITLSSNSASLTVPASVTVAAGSSSAGFQATAAAVNTDSVAVLTASYNGDSKTTSFSLLAPTRLSRMLTDPGVYRNGFWFIDWNGNLRWDAEDAAHVFAFGLPGDLPVMGDWNGDGRRKAGVYRNGCWFVDWNGNKQWDAEDAAHVFCFGLPGDLPVMGDWNGDGRLKVGFYRKGAWFVDWNGNNQWDAEDAAHVFFFGLPGDLPVMGDWSGDGRLKAGVYRNGCWFVDWNGNNRWDAEDAAHVFCFGLPGDLPVMGDWNGDGRLKVGVYRQGAWFVDWNGNYQWDLEDAAHVFFFGLPGDLPVVGHWDPSRQNAKRTDAPVPISALQTSFTTDEAQHQFEAARYQAAWDTTLHILDTDAELRTAVERIEREQKEIIQNPEFQRQISDMERDVDEILSRPEVLNEVRRMQHEMETREQLQPQRDR